MKKYLFLALVSLLSPLVASAITPKVGHYVGEAIDFHHVVHRKISFTLKLGRIYGLDIQSAGIEFNHSAHLLAGTHINFHARGALGLQSFDGHIKWETDTKVAGDFREYPINSPDLNTYYTWHAHWVHN